MKQPHILIITDHFDLARTWVPGLSQINAKVSIVSCGKVPDLRDGQKPPYAAIIIDTYTANYDFIDLTQTLRKNFKNEILLLTYDRDERLHLLLYQSGVDEVIVKPISIPLLLAKVMVWLRHAETDQNANGLTKVPRRQKTLPFSLDPYRRLLMIEEGKALHLSNLEYNLISLLMNNEGQVLETDLIIDRVWSRYGTGDKVMLKNLIHRLRRKIEPDPGVPRYIHTIKGQGYLFQVEGPLPSGTVKESEDFATQIDTLATFDTNFDTQFNTLSR